RLLAAHGPAARSDVLAFVLGGCRHLSSLVLRAGVRGEVVAAAGDISSPAPSPRRAADDHWVLDLPVRALGSTYGVLTAVSARPLTATEAGLLATIADLFAVLSATPVDPAVAARLVLDVEADFALLATDLDETLGEALVALRHTDSSRLDEAVRGALSTL